MLHRAELRRLAAECPQCGDTGACNGGLCPLAAESSEPPVHGESVAALAGYTTDRRDQWADEQGDTATLAAGAQQTGTEDDA
ncbi:hypothetical protein ACIPMW_32295 [Streptomyces sp. NPDC086669]|uniref:hypothetical protein n=1 Tax=Streptomyces sp. NPDC086669 TaxID=3365753 RepID=UPI003819FF35